MPFRLERLLIGDFSEVRSAVSCLQPESLTFMNENFWNGFLCLHVDIPTRVQNAKAPLLGGLQRLELTIPVRRNIQLMAT
jgi:hypothetical protein